MPNHLRLFVLDHRRLRGTAPFPSPQLKGVFETLYFSFGSESGGLSFQVITDFHVARTLVRLRHRQAHDEGRAAAFALGFDLSAVRLDQLFDERETDAEAAVPA